MKASKVLRFAVAAAFAGGSAISYAQSALTSTAGTLASELPTNGILVDNAGGQFNISSNTTTFAPSIGQSLQITVTLDNGAKFTAGAPAMKCQASNSAAGGATAATANGTLNLGGAGSNQGIWTVGQTEVSAVASGGSISACTIVATGFTVTGAHVSNNATISYQYGTLANSTAAGAFITWKKGVSASVTAGQAATALVTGGFVNVAGGVSATMVSAGLVKYAGNGSAFATAAAATNATAGDVMSTASITVGGTPLGAAATTGGVFLTTAGDTCATANAAASATGGLASVTFAGFTTAQIASGYNVCVRFNGTTAIPEGSITATIAVGALTGYTPSTTTASNVLTTITRNGSSTRALNITPVTNSDQTFVRVTNTSTLAGKLYGTMYGQDGVRIGNANAELASATEFVQNATLVFDAATLKTKLGITADWTGRAQLVLTAETTGLRAQNLIRTSNGTLVNVGGDTSSANN